MYVMKVLTDFYQACMVMSRPCGPSLSSSFLWPIAALPIAPIWWRDDQLQDLSVKSLAETSHISCYPLEHKRPPLHLAEWTLPAILLEGWSIYSRGWGGEVVQAMMFAGEQHLGKKPISYTCTYTVVWFPHTANIAHLDSSSLIHLEHASLLEETPKIILCLHQSCTLAAHKNWIFHLWRLQ